MIDPRTVPLRFSHLKMFAQSPAHYFDAVQSDGMQTRSLRLGTLAHSVLFPNTQPFTIYGGDRRGNEWKEFEKAHSGRPVFTRKEVEKVLPMAEAIAAHSDASRLIKGRVEQTIRWDYLGRAAQSTPDIVSESFITDVKTARTSHPDRFGRSAIWYGYHAQLAFYRLAVMSTTCVLIDELYNVVVESKRPYPVTVFRVTERACIEGEKMIRSWFEQLRVCEESNRWPAYSQSIVDLDVPDHDEDELVFGDENEDAAAQ